MQQQSSGRERRQYIRLDSVFPVSFRLLNADETAATEWMQGFTHNVSSGGILLDINNIQQDLIARLKQPGAKLMLKIQMPLAGSGVEATAQVAWFKEPSSAGERAYAGLIYERIQPSAKRTIMRYVWGKKLFLPSAISVIFILSFAIAINTYLNVKLVQGNRALVEQLVKIIQEFSIAKQRISDISGERDQLELKIGALQSRMLGIEEEKKILEEKAQQLEQRSSLQQEQLRQEQDRIEFRIKEFNATIEKLGKEKSGLQEKLVALQQKETAVASQLLRLDEKKAILEKANVEAMYRWLCVHQNPRTGLVMSFEGDSDLANWAFTYDQSLAAQVFAIFSDPERARKTIDFFAKKAKQQNGLFFNAYYATDGSPAEFVVHSGPNIWLGIALLQYANKTQDVRYQYLAEQIATAIMKLQEEDGGGIRGGPNTEWYATEHNLDGYAFFRMLERATGKPVYRQAADKVLKWLQDHTYDQQDVPIKRGKGDSTIATDTYAWSIASVGPEKLNEIGMSPDKIMEFAEQNCGVEVPFARPDGQTIHVKGFDFAPQRHVSRGGVVSTEWTAQMVNSFRIMSEYYQKKGMTAKARSYSDKADDYLIQLCNMVISSPSPSGQGEGCLPYASCDFVDTGHGWVTPKGASTGSVSGTAYTIFAYYRYNPLQFEQ